MMTWPSTGSSCSTGSLSSGSSVKKPKMKIPPRRRWRLWRPSNILTRRRCPTWSTSPQKNCSWMRNRTARSMKRIGKKNLNCQIKQKMSQRRKKRSRRNKKEAPHEVDQNYGEEKKIRLNKYIAHCGFCSRRKVDDYIAAGKVEVNDEVVTQMGVKVQRTDKVVVEGQRLSLEKFVYLLLNKPKDTITTTDDPRNRTTVMDKIEDATGKRVYPVGRLDRHTMGLLLLTNDGDLTNRLMHPSYEVRKTYEVETERKLTGEELQELAGGIELEDGPARAHNLVTTPGGFMLSIFEGRNRLVRRMAEYFGTEVIRLKRVEYAGLTLENVRMGRWRYLKKNEINALRKMVKLKPLDFDQ